MIDELRELEIIALRDNPAMQNDTDRFRLLSLLHSLDNKYSNLVVSYYPPPFPPPSFLLPLSPLPLLSPLFTIQLPLSPFPPIQSLSLSLPLPAPPLIRPFFYGELPSFAPFLRSPPLLLPIPRSHLCYSSLPSRNASIPSLPFPSLPFPLPSLSLPFHSLPSLHNYRKVAVVEEDTARKKKGRKK